MPTKCCLQQHILRTFKNKYHSKYWLTYIYNYIGGESRKEVTSGSARLSIMLCFTFCFENVDVQFMYLYFSMTIKSEVFNFILCS